MKIFKDRIAAGKILAQRLKNTKADLVLGIPRGGVVVAYEVAKALNLPFDILVTRKIGVPNQPELALGAIDPDGEAVFDQALLDQFQIPNIKFQIEKEWKELERREDLYREGKPLLDLRDKTAILVDDGIATGATTLSAVKYLKRYRAKVILAVPVASREAWEKINKEADQTIVLEIPENFQAVGQFYQQFEPVTDEEVVQYLA